METQTQTNLRLRHAVKVVAVIALVYLAHRGILIASDVAQTRWQAYVASQVDAQMDRVIVDLEVDPKKGTIARLTEMEKPELGRALFVALNRVNECQSYVREIGTIASSAER